jgi:Tfp pilus assembly protein PilF
MLLKRLGLVCIVLSSLTACVNKPHEVSNDEINNKYYYDYVAMYKAYGTVPADTTLAALKKYIEKFPNNHQAWAFLGRVHMDLKQLSEAERDYRTALGYKANYGPALAGLGALYAWSDKNDSALILFNKAIASGDSTANNYLNVSIINIKKRDTAAAQLANGFFTKLDSLDNSSTIYLTAVNKELKNKDKVEQLQAALQKKGIQDSLLDLYMAGKIKATEFFNQKRATAISGK